MEKILKLFKNHFPNYPVIAIWESDDSYLVAIEIKSGKELADGFIKVDKSKLQIIKDWGYQQHLDEFKTIISKPPVYVSK